MKILLTTFLICPIGQIVKEMQALPLKDKVKEKWLYKNAQQLLRMN
jgi:predicted TIM-barrel fold metal-dependent hydrolase